MRFFCAILLGLTVTGKAVSDEPLPWPEIWETCSPNGVYCARLDPDDTSITVYRVDEGDIMWRGTGWSRAAALADDGEHLVLGYEGLNLIPHNYDREMVMLTFYKNGEIIQTVPLHKLVRRFTILRNKTVSHYKWGDFLGIVEDGHLAIKTAAGWKKHFDMTTGERVRP